MKSCIDSVKKYWWLFAFIFLLYPLVVFSEFLWHHFAGILGSFFMGIEELARKYKNSVQLILVIGVIGGFWKFLYDRKQERERNLASVSIINVRDDGVATIQNTSSSSILRVKVCRPRNFEKAESETFLGYTARSEKDYKEKVSSLKNTSNWENICWEKILEADLFIGEKTSFHIKNVADEDGALVHFAPIWIEIRLRGNGSEPKMKRVLFRYVSKNLQNSEGLGKDKYHPYGKWIRLR